MMAKQKEPEKKKKQLKVFLTLEEHAAVSVAANAKEMSIGDYMKMAVIEKAKKDSVAMIKKIQNL